MKIMISGGKGLLASHIVEANTHHEIIALTPGQMDVTVYNELLRAIIRHKPDVFLHCAAMTTPMEDHDRWPAESIGTNIIGTAHVALACQYLTRTRLVYISTDYVYPGIKGPYHEDSPLMPVNNYARSKLAGEMAVQMLPNSLILRCAFTKRPFPHQRAFTDHLKSYLYVDEIAPIILALIESGYEGVVNVGGKHRTVHEFAVESVPNVGQITRAEVGDWVPADTGMDLGLMRKVLSK